MKRIIIIVILAVICVAALFGKISLVGAAPGSNPNYMSRDDINEMLQTTMDVIYKDIDAVKAAVDKNDQNIDDISGRLDKIDADLSLIKAKLN